MDQEASIGDQTSEKADTGFVRKGSSMSAYEIKLPVPRPSRRKRAYDGELLARRRRAHKSPALEPSISKTSTGISGPQSDIDRDLLRAVQEGRVKEVRKFLENSANPNGKDMSGTTVLHYAARYGNRDVIKELLKHADININLQDNDGSTPLHLAVSFRGSDLDLIKDFLKHKDININLQDNNGRTALHLAIPQTWWTLDRRAITKLLEHKDININLQDNGGRTALHLAVSFRGSDVDLIKELLEHKDININLQDNNGRAALHLAVSFRGFDVDFIKEFLKHKDININLQDNVGETALDIAPLLLRNTMEQLYEDQPRSMANAKNIVFPTEKPGGGGRSGGQPLNSEVEHSSTSSATLSGEEPPTPETQGNHTPSVLSDYLTDRETSEYSGQSFTALGLDNTNEGEREDYCEDIDDFSNEDDKGQNDDSDYDMQLTDAGTYRRHGGGTGGPKGKGKLVSTKRKGSEDRPNGQDDEDDDNSPNKPSKRLKRAGIKGELTGNHKKPFACPYFKRSQYLCSQWKGHNIQGVINHCISQHLKLWCPRCKEFQADDQPEMNRHLAHENCPQKDAGDIYSRNEANTDIRDELVRYRPPKACTWSGVYTILFHRDTPVIPDGFWSEAEATAADIFGDPSLKLSQCVTIPFNKQEEYQSGLAASLANHLRLDEDYLKKRIFEFNMSWAANNSNQVQFPGIDGSGNSSHDINNGIIASEIPSGGLQPTFTEQVHNPAASNTDQLQYITTATAAAADQGRVPSQLFTSLGGPATGPSNILQAETGEIRVPTALYDTYSQNTVDSNMGQDYALEHDNDHTQDFLDMLPAGGQSLDEVFYY